MTRQTLVAALLFAVSPLAAGWTAGSSARAEEWPQWRGPRGDGTSREEGLPTRWSGDVVGEEEGDGVGIAWKVAVPGIGHGSPIVAGGSIYLVTCDEESRARLLIAMAADSGETRWRKTVFEGPLETKHQLNSRASCTPAADEDRVYAAFLEVDGRTVPAPNVGAPRPITPGEVLVVAYGHDGELAWKRSVGPFVSAHGFSSNPVLFEDLVVVNGDHDGDAYIVALERETGEERWRIDRENETRSYVTPIFREAAGRWQMILSGSLCVASYDPRTGKRHWILDGPTEQFVASPVFDGERVFITGGYPDRHILAIRPDGSGNVTDTHIAWRTNRGAAYVPSPILAGEHLVVVSDRGIASCFVAATGERLWMERLEGGHSASPVTADGLVYFTSDEGVTTVIRPGKEFDVVATNPLGERCSASPAVSGGRIFLRGERHLFAIEGGASED